MNAPESDKHAATGHALDEKLHDTYEKGKESLSSCCDTICSQSSQLCDATSEAIRKNPISSVIGAAFVGAAVAYLILEGRHEPTFRERYVDGPLSDASDSVHDSLRSIYDTFKFW